MGDLVPWIAGYMACSAAAFWLLQHDWRHELDVDPATFVFLLALAALGPVALGAGIGVNGARVAGKIVKRVTGPNRIIWRRYK